MALNPAPLQSGLPVQSQMAGWPKPWGNWFARAWQILSAAEEAGLTANRPTANLWTGRPYFDTTLGQPIWWDGAAWVDATGTPA